MKVETPRGIVYYRYNGDGYGEHEDGRPFDGTGIGRAWPLLTGERSERGVLLGIDPLPYLELMARMTGPGGLIPEQVWGAAPIPERRRRLARRIDTPSTPQSPISDSSSHRRRAGAVLTAARPRCDR